MKTLAMILHYNTPEYTDSLYRMLKPYERDDYDLTVLDNGSSPDKLSQYSTFTLKENLYFGGGLNAAFKIFLEKKEYDSLLFLNSDLILHGENFVRALRNEMIGTDYKIVVPCILQPEERQHHWKPVGCWNAKKIRPVLWAEFQAPLIHRDFIEYVKAFDDDLRYGYGIDILAGMFCNAKKWQIGVCDFVPAIHICSATVVKESKTDPAMRSYYDNATAAMEKYFSAKNLTKEFETFRTYGFRYTYDDV